MNAELNNNEAHCPSKEDLSDWYDNGGNDGIAHHVDDCNQCDAAVTFYRRVDETVRLTAEPPQHLSSSVIEACHAVQGEILAFPTWMRVLRMAAAAAVVVTVGGIIYLVGPGSGAVSDTNRVVQADENDGPTELAAFGNPRVQPGRDAPRNIVGARDGVSGSEVINVSTAGSKRTGSGSRHGGPTGASVDSDVRHVWVVQDMERSQKQFLEILPTGVDPVKKDEGDGTKYSFEAVMTDVQLQKLVDALQEKGWALFTKDWPQPHEADKVSLDGHQVRYVIDLVKKTE